VIRLVARDPAVSLDEAQVRRIKFWLLEFIPAGRCEVSLDAPVEITVTGHQAPDLHPPLLERVESIAGCRFDVAVQTD
jgi:hypothetical protein